MQKSMNLLLPYGRNLYLNLKDYEISWRWQSEEFTILRRRWDALHASLCKVMVVVVVAMVERQKTSCLHRNSMTHLPFRTWVTNWTCLLSNLLTAPRAGSSLSGSLFIFHNSNFYANNLIYYMHNSGNMLDALF